MSDSPPQFSAEVMALVLDTIEELVVLTDRNGCRIYASPSYRRVLGDDPSPGSDSMESVHPDDRERIRTLLTQVVGTGRGERAEYRYLVPGGGMREVESQSTPVFGADGKVSHVLVVSRDITEARAKERAARAVETQLLTLTQQHLRSLIDMASDACVILDDAGLIVEWNPAAERMFGWTCQEALGKGFAGLVFAETERPNFESSVREVAAEVVQNPPGQLAEWQALARDGGVLAVEVALWPVRTGSRCTFGAIIRDITQRKRHEQEIQAMLAHERELSELKSRFITMTSHEFRTPLATIQSSIELFERYQDRLSSGDRQELISSIRDAVQRSAAMLDDILLIGKADAGKIEHCPEPVRLQAFCGRLVEAYMVELPPGLEIDCRIDCDTTVCLDPKLLELALGNLLSNAIKYSNAPGTVTLRVACEDGTVRFTVSDRGIGIPESDLPRLYESFHRAANVGTIPGSGLGLALVKRAIDLQQGAIDVSSRLGAGTTFTITLPITHQAQGAT